MVCCFKEMKVLVGRKILIEGVKPRKALIKRVYDVNKLKEIQ